MNASALDGFRHVLNPRTETQTSAWSAKMSGSTRRAQPRSKKPTDPEVGNKHQPVQSGAIDRTPPATGGAANPGAGEHRSSANPGGSSTPVTMLLDDATWQAIENLPEVGRVHPIGRRPTDDRKVLEAVLWVMRHQARWQDLPDGYPSPRTCQRRLRRWQAGGTWEAIWRTYIDRLSDEALHEWGEVFMAVILADAEDEQADQPGGASRVGRPPFWWSMARQFWRWTWDRQSAEQRRRIARYMPGTPPDDSHR